MTQEGYKQTLENLFKTSDRLLDEEGEIRGQLIRALARKYDADLLQLLMSDENIKNKFFIHTKLNPFLFGQL